MKKTIAVVITSILLSACSPQSVSVDYWTNKDVAGPDVDGNGIRDDVDEWIASQNFKPALDYAVKKAAKIDYIISKAEPADTAEFLALLKEQMDAYSCVWSSPIKFDSNGNSTITDWMIVSTMNTRERYLHEFKSDAVFSGHTYTLPFTKEEVAAACE